MTRKPDTLPAAWSTSTTITTSTTTTVVLVEPSTTTTAPDRHRGRPPGHLTISDKLDITQFNCQDVTSTAFFSTELGSQSLVAYQAPRGLLSFWREHADELPPYPTLARRARIYVKGK